MARYALRILIWCHRVLMTNEITLLARFVAWSYYRKFHFISFYLHKTTYTVTVICIAVCITNLKISCLYMLIVTWRCPGRLHVTQFVVDMTVL